MTLTRFLTLLIVYALSTLAGLTIISKFGELSFLKKWLIVTVIGFIVLATPLTILTLLK